MSNSIDKEHIVTQAKVLERIYKKSEVRFICKTNKDAKILLEDLRAIDNLSKHHFITLYKPLSIILNVPEVIEET